MNISVRTHSPAQTRALGRRLAAALGPGDVVALEGELGTGKTVLVQGIAEGLGVTASVHSPTFTLHHHYPGPVALEHYDLFRLDARTWADAGLEDPAPTSVTVVEWSDRARPLEGWSTVRIQFQADGDSRTITCLKGSDGIRACFEAAARA